MSCADRCLRLFKFLSPVPTYDVDAGLLPLTGLFGFCHYSERFADSSGILEGAVQLLAQSIFQTEVVFDK